METLTFERIKPGRNLKNVADLQKKVVTIFCELDELATDKPFLEFSDVGLREKSELLRTFAEKAKQKGVKGAVEMALKFAEKKLNLSLVQSALAVFLTHNEEARHLGVVVPPLALLSKFKRIKRSKPYPVSTDTLRGTQLLAYFREDYDLNDHHYHWHHVFPTTGIPDADAGGNKFKCRIQRQGELFLYMHSQMVARYNAELLAWGLEATHPFSYDDIISFGYVPPPGIQELYSLRPANRGWFNNNNPAISNNTTPPKSEMVTYRNNIFKDIEMGRFLTVDANGEHGEYPLTESNSINTVGVVVEALSPELQEVQDGVKTDRTVYGSLHNNGHNKFAEIGYTMANPKYGVMGDTHEAIRDHVFWLWHRHVDDFRRIIVSKYTHNLLTYKADAEILNLRIAPRNLDSETPNDSVTEGIATYLCPPDIDRNEVNAKLRHEPYDWSITVKSTLHTPPTEACPQLFTIRLFIILETLIEDQNAWIEMDKFTVSLTKQQDTFTRKDIDSAVARKVRPFTSDSRCSCGWPQNLMLPVGTPDGLPYVAFAMLTGGGLGQDTETHSLSFCGVENDRYPDPLGMGYPFNKVWESRATSDASVESIVEHLPHIKLSRFNIYRFVKLQVDEREIKAGDLVYAFQSWMNILEGKEG